MLIGSVKCGALETLVNIMGTTILRKMCSLGQHINYSPILCSEHPLTDDPWCSYNPIIRAGCRLPFCHVYSADDPTLEVIYDLVASLGYTSTFFILQQMQRLRGLNRKFYQQMHFTPSFNILSI